MPLKAFPSGFQPLPDSPQSKNASHELQPEATEKGAHPLPERPPTAELLPRGSEERTAQLLRLVHREGRHHELYKDDARILLTELTTQFGNEGVISTPKKQADTPFERERNALMPEPK